MNCFSEIKTVIYQTILILTVFSFFNIQIYAGDYTLYDQTHAMDSGKMVFLNSNLAAVRIYEWEGEKDSVKMVVSLSSHIDSGIVSEDFFDFVKLDFTQTKAGPQWEFYIADAPAYWWKLFFGLRDKTAAEVFLIDLFLPKNFLLFDAEINNGSLTTFNGFPTSMQVLLNQSKADLHGDYWTLIMQLENSKLEVESANSIMLLSSHSEVKVFNCNSFTGSGSYSKIAIGWAGNVEFSGEFCKMEITFAESLSSRFFKHSEIFIFFVDQVEINGADTDINIWYLMNKLGLSGERMDLNIRHMGRFMNEIIIQGIKINAQLGRVCNYGYDYSITGSDSEVHLPDFVFFFGEKKDYKTGNIGDFNRKKIIKLEMVLEKSKIYFCPKSN